MKKIILITISLLIIMIGANFTIKALKTYEVENEYVCSVLENAKYSIEGYPMKFITQNNELYILSDKLFSDETNCKKLASNVKFVYKDFFLGQDNKYYQISNYQAIEIGEDNYLREDYEQLIKELNIDEIDKYISRYYLSNNKIYTETNELYNYKINKENIVDFSIGENSEVTNDYIKTKNAYYFMEIINKEQCQKYAEITCEYDYVKNNFLTEKYNEIAFVTSLTEEYIYAVMKDGRQIKIVRK